MYLERTVTILMVVFVFIGILSGCATNPAAQKTVPVSEMPQKRESAIYLIQPGDELDIKLFYNPELNETITVRPDGKISLQLIDEVHATGLQPAELDDMLTKAYSHELKKPVVTVIVRSFAGQRIYVDPFCRDETEAAATWGPAVLLSTIIQANGASIYLSRSIDTAPTERVRALRANRLNVDIVISLCLAGTEGPGVYYFASELSSSSAGKALADPIGVLLDAPHSGRAIPILKNTRSPAVVVAVDEFVVLQDVESVANLVLGEVVEGQPDRHEVVARECLYKGLDGCLRRREI